MLKRLIGVITVKNDWAVQSFGFNRYLPLGRPEVIAENLDWWQIDEILIANIDRTKLNLGPNFRLLEKISKKRLMTPLSYLGGVRNSDDAINLVNSGADRVALESLFVEDRVEAHRISEAIGRQAVIRCLSLVCMDGEIYHYDYLSEAPLHKIRVNDLVEYKSSFSELMILDVENDGGKAAFSELLLKPFQGQDIQLICFGGITDEGQVDKLFGFENVSAVGVGNSLNYKEIANKKILTETFIDTARSTSFGKQTRGAKEW